MSGIERYIEEHSSAEDPLLTELDRATNLRVIQPKMVSGRVQGAFLRLVTEILQPRRVLEIGTFTGYSALSIAAGLEEQPGNSLQPHAVNRAGHKIIERTKSKRDYYYMRSSKP